MRWWCMAVLWIAGCYRPATEAPCTVHCEYLGEQSCPGNQECQQDNVCHAAGGGCGDVTDADMTLIDLPNGGPPYCFGSGLLRLCMPSLTDDIVTLPSMINTSVSSDCVPTPQPQGGPDVCVIYGRIIRDTVPVRAEGSRALVLVATESIQISRGIDVSSRSGFPGAGASSVICLAPTAPRSLGGGAAGGTYQGPGGVGGDSEVGNGGDPAPAVGLPTHVRAGCAGGVGNNGSIVSMAALGGGAVYLIAASSITIASGAQIDASGAGAVATDGSGNGGGSGGLIGLDAAILSSQGQIWANGGGGASGYNNGHANPGTESPSPIVRGAGGVNADGGSGGVGSAGVSLLAGVKGSAIASGNGGGGGGGAGFIVAYPTGHASSVGGPNVSPPAL